MHDSAMHDSGAVDAGPHTANYLLFRVGKLLCALPVACVIETLRPLPVETIASAPACVLGLALIRGMPTPVVDVARLLADVAPETDAVVPIRFITVRAAAGRGAALAIAVGAVLGIEALDATVVQRLPPLLGDAAAQGVQAIGRLDAQVLVLLNAARLIDDVQGVLAARSERPS